MKLNKIQKEMEEKFNDFFISEILLSHIDIKDIIGFIDFLLKEKIPIIKKIAIEELEQENVE